MAHDFEGLESSGINQMLIGRHAAAGGRCSMDHAAREVCFFDGGARRMPSWGRRAVHLEAFPSRAMGRDEAGTGQDSARKAVKARVLLSPTGAAQQTSVDGHVDVLKRFREADGNVKENMYAEALKAAAAVKVRELGAMLARLLFTTLMADSRRR